MTTRNVFIIVAILIVLGLAWWLFMPQGAVAPTSGATTTAQAATTTAAANQTTTAGGKTNTSLRSVISQTGNFTCSMVAVTSSGQNTGTIYGAGGKVRLDFSANVNGSTYNTHIIRANGYSYTWVDGQTTGVKTAITATSAVAPAQGSFINDDSSVSTDCHPWVPDNTQFVPPKGITFTAR